MRKKIIQGTGYSVNFQWGKWELENIEETLRAVGKKTSGLPSQYLSVDRSSYLENPSCNFHTHHGCVSIAH